MIDHAGHETSRGVVRGRSARNRHWWRWILAGVVVLVAAVFLGLGAYLAASSSPPLALPTAAAQAPLGKLDGTWEVASGSVAGFRIQQTVLCMSGDITGRTTTVTGTVVVSNGQITSATFRIDLRAVRVGGKPQPQFALSLDAQDHPEATVTLDEPITLSSAFASGASIRATATAHLAMHGASRPVTFTVSGRRDGSTLQASGSIPITFSDWRINGPTGYGIVGSLADHGTAEFLVVLRRI